MARANAQVATELDSPFAMDAVVAIAESLVDNHVFDQELPSVGDVYRLARYVVAVLLHEGFGLTKQTK